MKPADFAFLIWVSAILFGLFAIAFSNYMTLEQEVVFWKFSSLFFIGHLFLQNQIGGVEK